MGLPNVSIEVLNNQLGASGALDDGIMGLVLSCDVAPASLAASTPKAIFSLAEAVALGIDEDYDTDNTVDCYLQIKDFYTTAPVNTELWIMVIPQTTTLTSACDKTSDIVKKLLRESGANGRVKMWGITRVPDGAYTPTYDAGYDDDASDAIAKAHELCVEQQTLFNPCRALIGALDFQGDVGDLEDLKTRTNNTVQMVIGATTDDGYPAVGYTLGQYANRPVQRKISRVKDGALGLNDAYMSDGNTVETYATGADAAHDKGYVFFRKFANKTGYYFSGDPACCADTDDYASIARGRVIDKALRIAYATFVEEIEDDITIDENGYMDPSVVKGYQNKIENAIENQMSDEISGVRCVIDPAQNVLSTNKVTIQKLGTIPRGYSSYIDISLGFDNPQNV